MKKKSFINYLCTICLTLTLFVFIFDIAIASEPIKLKAISFINTNTEIAKVFIDYIDRVNKKTKDKMVITFLGGPEVIPAREQVGALRNGLVDLAIAPTAYQMKLVPSNLAWSISHYTPWEEKKSGFFDLMSQLYLEADMKLLGVTGRGGKMYFFLNRDVKTMEDLKGLRIRTIPNIRTILENFQSKGVTVPRSDVYIAMERGIIDGFLSPTDLVLELGQQEVCDYWIDHGFLVSPITYVSNVKKWRSFPKDIQEILSQTMKEIEKDYYSVWFANDKAAKEELIKAGIKKITFSSSDAKKFLDAVHNGFISDFERTDPQNAEKFRKLMTN